MTGDSESSAIPLLGVFVCHGPMRSLVMRVAIIGDGSGLTPRVIASMHWKEMIPSGQSCVRLLPDKMMQFLRTQLCPVSQKGPEARPPDGSRAERMKIDYGHM